MREILQWKGATVTAVGSAEDALEALQRERPSVGEPHRTSVLRAGFQCHLEKPVRVDDLVGVVGMLARTVVPSPTARGVGSAESDAKPMRFPVIGEHDSRLAAQKDTIELH